MARYVVYCDSRSDELLAETWLAAGPLTGATIARLPTLARAPGPLKPLLSWERLDWVVTSDDVPVCAVEFSRHGYTGDNSFQRFARLYRSASLGIPVLYFTAFSRTRLNELDAGQASPRNVAPELFQTMDEVSARFAVPCLGVDWPVTDDGTPAPLTSPIVTEARQQLVGLVELLSTHPNPGANQSLAGQFPATIERMAAQATLEFRGSDTRGLAELPLTITSPAWVRSWLPDTYFSTGKADKILASYVLDLVDPRPTSDFGNSDEFTDLSTIKGRVQVLYLGYQWRPDPSCGLIALSAAQAAVAGVPLLVVWPRVYYEPGAVQVAASAALRDFREDGMGPLLVEGQRLGFSADALADLRARVSGDANQFGVYSTNSKIHRVLQETATAIVFGDKVVRFR